MPRARRLRFLNTRPTAVLPRVAPLCDSSWESETRIVSGRVEYPSCLMGTATYFHQLSITPEAQCKWLQAIGDHSHSCGCTHGALCTGRFPSRKRTSNPYCWDTCATMVSR